jgi:nicotinate-nucleotide pyrophosphorylase (carboxylating)
MIAWILLFLSLAVFGGIEIVREVFKSLDKNIKFKTFFQNGAKVKAGTTVVTLTGKTHALLSGERVALNFLQHLSGIATLTNKFVEQAKPFKADLLDTRKTTPGLRDLEKWAVRCGGGKNHRRDLSDMVLIKDNHITALKAKSLKYILAQTKQRSTKKIEIEVDNLNQFKEVMKMKPNIILLDNMSVKRIRKAVQLRNRLDHKRNIQLEVSGGVNLKNVRAYAQTGVERISVGALTHSIQSIDISMEIIHV